jgi:hypothetical protein
MTEEERQQEAGKQLHKLEVTVDLPEEKPTEDKETENAYNLMPDSIRKQLPKLYSTKKGLIGDKVAYARYFFPMGAYTAYLLEYDPKTRIGFGAVTMGYGWELGNMSLDEMEEVKIHGLGIGTRFVLYTQETARDCRIGGDSKGTIYQGTDDRGNQGKSRADSPGSANGGEAFHGRRKG